MFIEYHMDDFGMFRSQTECAYEMLKTGALSGVSVMPNSPMMEEVKTWLSAAGKNIRISVHLNFFEGKCCGGAENVPLLINEAGELKASFAKLSLVSLLPVKNRKRIAWREQLEKEIEAQIKAVVSVLPAPERPLRIDGHAHFQCIPVVFEALTNVINDGEWKVEFLRVPAEHYAHYRGIHCEPINWLKAVILNIYLRKDRRIARAKGGEAEKLMEKMLSETRFYGVMLSGHMTLEPVTKLRERVRTDPVEYVEMLFHPGKNLKAEEIAELTSDSDQEFWKNPKRGEEMETLLQLRDNE